MQLRSISAGIDADADYISIGRKAAQALVRLRRNLIADFSIKGEVRADLYLGLGPAAGVEAGRVRHTLRLYRLVPKDNAP